MFEEITDKKSWTLKKLSIKQINYRHYFKLYFNIAIHIKNLYIAYIEGQVRVIFYQSSV